jgi:hypothetical protein
MCPHALVTTIGSRPSGGRPRFFPTPPPAAPAVPVPSLAAAAESPASAPGEPFGMCRGQVSPLPFIVGVAIPVATRIPAQMPTGVTDGTTPIDPDMVPASATISANCALLA